MRVDPRVLRVLGALCNSIADQIDGGVVITNPPRQLPHKRPAPKKVRSTRIA